ncbi:hypothetical protein LTR72_011180 [Exophiala xenobiotica]|nr:hypothetical protein LTR72_011180 [Exophiala xenobiotica]KAK5285297.1 hypothetical protein LTR14_011048 [Exophiala xenobiotica]
MAVDGFGAAMCQMAAFALPELLQINGDILVEWRQLTRQFLRCGRSAGPVFLGFALFLLSTCAPSGSAAPGCPQGDRLYWYGAVREGIPARPHGHRVDVYIPGQWQARRCVIGCVVSLVVGALILFALWETLGWAKHLLTPPEVFRRRKGRDFTAPRITLAVINMFYYSSSIIWPTMIAAYYTPSGEPWAKAAPLSTAQGLAITVGACSLSAFGSRIRYWQWQQTVSVTVVVVFGRYSRW